MQTYVCNNDLYQFSFFWNFQDYYNQKSLMKQCVMKMMDSNVLCTGSKVILPLSEYTLSAVVINFEFLAEKAAIELGVADDSRLYRITEKLQTIDVWCQLGNDCKRKEENNCVVNSNRINQQISCPTHADDIKWLINNVDDFWLKRFIIITKVVAEKERNNSNKRLKNVLTMKPNKQKKIKRKCNYDHECRVKINTYLVT